MIRTDVFSETSILAQSQVRLPILKYFCDGPVVKLDYHITLRMLSLGFESLLAYQFINDPFEHQLVHWFFKPEKTGQHRHGLPFYRVVADKQCTGLQNRTMWERYPPTLPIYKCDIGVYRYMRVFQT